MIAFAIMFGYGIGLVAVEEGVQLLFMAQYKYKN
jgi:hypothetical protein